MTTDHDRLLRLNLAQVVLQRLTTVPGGLPDLIKRIRESTSGPRSPNLDPGRGGRKVEFFVDDDGVFAAERPSDPVGEAILIDDDDEANLEQLLGDLDQLHAAVLNIAGAIDDYTAPSSPKISDADGFSRDWCRSCWRVDHTCTAVTRRADGRAYYAGMCRACGDLRKDLNMRVGSLPPRALVERRLKGGPLVTRRGADGVERIVATPGDHLTEGLLKLYRVPPSKRRRRGRKGKRAA